jgi:hypothetical protein
MVPAQSTAEAVISDYRLAIAESNTGTYRRTSSSSSDRTTVIPAVTSASPGS